MRWYGLMVFAVVFFHMGIYQFQGRRDAVVDTAQLGILLLLTLISVQLGCLFEWLKANRPAPATPAPEAGGAETGGA